MRNIVFIARNKDSKHEIALALGVLNVVSMATSSWIIHTGYLLQDPQQNITNPGLTEAALIDLVQNTTMRTGTGKGIPYYNHILQTLQFKSS